MMSIVEIQQSQVDPNQREQEVNRCLPVFLLTPSAPSLTILAQCTNVLTSNFIDELSHQEQQPGFRRFLSKRINLDYLWQYLA
jgi:hypothetical protein